jgi:hypothetical protein
MVEGVAADLVAPGQEFLEVNPGKEFAGRRAVSLETERSEVRPSAAVIFQNPSADEEG